MKKLMLIFTILLAGCSGTKTDQLEVFYAPHPDDEVLSLGPAIIHALSESEEVQVILLSKGKASKAINTVNERLEKEGHSPITTEEFGEARVKEFKAAVKALGVKNANVTVLDLPDGGITKEDAAELILEKEKTHTHVIHHVMSDLDPHSDHAAAGEALRELTDSNQVKHGRYYLPVQEHKNIPSAGTVTVSKMKQQKRQLKALEAYGIWDPPSGKYSIGQISVPSYFDMARTHMESRYHN